MAEWRNWSGSVAATPAAIVRPRTLAELAACVAGATKLRVTGAGHSFMPLCETAGTLVSLADLEGGIEIAEDLAGGIAADLAGGSETAADLEGQSVWAPAGWGLDRLTAALWAQGLSLINQGDINPQALAGATATGTHGTGAALGSISTQALGYRMLLADGERIECSERLHPELFQAQRLGLGLLGVATEIRLAVLPAYHLEERVCRMALAEVVARLPELSAATRHMEFFVFPYSDDVIFKTLHPAAAEGEFKGGEDIDESLFRRVCDIGVRAPKLIPAMQRTMMRASGKPARRVGPAYRIFPSERSIRFEEMEYEFPRASGVAALQAAIAHIRRQRLPIAFPFEYRLAAADDIWLSPFNRALVGEGGGASVSFHQYAKMPWAAHFRAIEGIFREHGGRPHWAKRHTLCTADVHRLYPRAGDFLAVRKTVDPRAKFANAHLSTLFGIAA